MAHGNRKIEVRADDETRSRWQAAADLEGCSLSEWVRRAADDRATDARMPAAGPASVAVARPVASSRSSKTRAPRARSEMCVHRRRPDQYCSRCDG